MDRTTTLCFAGRRTRSESILEIGVSRGASSRAWAEAFPAAVIHGNDVSESSMIFGHDRVITHCADVNDHLTMLRIAAESSPFQLIVDDGSHRLIDVLKAYSDLSPFTTDDGVYVIEDLQTESDLEVLMKIPTARCVDLRTKTGRYDDILAVIENRYSHSQA